MLRRLIALAGCCLVLACAAAQEVAPPLPRSAVFFAQDDQALDRFEENPARTRPMVDALVRAVTGQRDPVKAWRSLVTPADRVGIKVATAGGRYFSSHHGVVAAVIAGLEQAGVPRSRIVIWDRLSDELSAAGFVSQRGGYSVRAVDPPAGYDREATIVAPVLGKLMWGDLLFQEKQRRPMGKAKEEADQVKAQLEEAGATVELK